MHSNSQLSTESGIPLLQGPNKSHAVAPRQSSPACKHWWVRSCSAFVARLRRRGISAHILQCLLPDLQDAGWLGRACQLWKCFLTNGNLYVYFVTISIFNVLLLGLPVLVTSNSSPSLFSFLCVLPENHTSLFFLEILTSSIGRNCFCFQLLIFYEYFHIAQIFWDKIHYFSCSSYINITVYNFYASTGSFTATSANYF